LWLRALRSRPISQGGFHSPTPRGPAVCSVPCSFRGALEPGSWCFFYFLFYRHAPGHAPHGRGVLRTQRAGSTQATVHRDSLPAPFGGPLFVDPPFRPWSIRCLYANPYLPGILLPDMDPDGTAARTEGRGNFDPWLVCFCSSHRFSLALLPSTTSPLIDRKRVQTSSRRRRLHGQALLLAFGRPTPLGRASTTLSRRRLVSP
jgi:hypothetical protein